MLFMLFGTTAEMGLKSRQFFTESGFKLIQKYNYVPAYFPLRARYGERNTVSKSEVLECDFVYENNGMLIGFNKEQIIDAARGNSRCLLTISSETIDFIKHLKAAYGDYITVIGTYIDEATITQMFSQLSNVTDDELEIRISTSHSIKQQILDNYVLFDDIVIYGGEDSLFNYQAMCMQYSSIISKAEAKEKQLNDKNYVEMPYSGFEDYVFASYSHADKDKVFPILAKLQRAGCRIWYDEGIKGGENWRKILASKIESEKCVNFLLFNSKNSTSSIHVCAEINAALNCEKKIITIRQDESKFTLDLEMYLQTLQTLNASDTSFDRKLIEAIDRRAFI
ncbi:MAG: toll/interleukin-1 receptor domain-containing protein [Oscillospiraceae bacterium]|nr:toll/interleukin-1 receptor domain-containing protein [Oscillospiraceae bacterium]